MTKRTREKNNIAVYSRKKQNNDLFREIVSQNKVNEDDLLGKTRAITKIEETQIFNKLDIPVKQETPPEMELPKKKDEIKSTKNEIKKNKGIIAGLLLVLVLLLGGISGYFLMRNKFKDVTIELGTDTVEISEFLVSKNYEKNSSFVTNIDELSLDTVGDYDVTLKYKNKEQTVKLSVVDTTAPVVEFQDVTEYTGYAIEPEDFIISKTDLSDMEVSYNSEEKIDTNKYADYKINIIVKDVYGNETSQECTLSLGWLKRNVTLEIGEKNVKANMVVNVEADAKKIPDSALKAIDINNVGDYEVSVVYDGVEYTSSVKVVDTVNPVLTLKKVIVYENTEVEARDFIKTVSDNSGKVTTELVSDIPSGYGTFDVVIKAVDPSGNETEATTTLTRKQDKSAPVISGLTTITINKGGTPNYTSGVKAHDNVDGDVDFNFDSSSVNNNVAGSYYVTYTAKDSKGNRASQKRTIVVKHDASDTKREVENFANSLSSDVPTLVDAVRTKIKYSNSWGDDDPVWYGLYEKRGNCYVHAKVLEAVLNKKGITNKLIWTYDKSHYWNLVYVNGSWRHVDSTPGNNYVLLTDEEMASKLPVTKGGGWDPSGWPATN